MSRRFPPTPLVRAALLRGLRLLLRLRASPLVPPPSLLVVAPHPDDECLGCGGLIAATRAGGGRVRILFLSDGEAAGGAPDPALGVLRRAESCRAAERLGVSENELHWLGLPDSRLDRLSPSGQSALQALLLGLLGGEPASLVAVSASLDASSEHQAAARMVIRALHDLPRPPPLVGYLVWSAWSPRLLLGLLLGRTTLRRFALDAPSQQLKSAALSCHASQLSPGPLPAAACLPRGFARALCSRDEFFLLEPAAEVPSRQAQSGHAT